MSKFQKIKEQYPSVTNSILQKLYNEDWTKSKKYFPFMVRIWNDKGKNQETFTSYKLIDIMKKFDDLLPYVPNKDISSSLYSSLSSILGAVKIAEEIREEKTFVREEHVLVLDETEDYIFLSPITHRGSLKYGANTKWCTASKFDDQTFLRYNKSGFLSYLICKNGKITGKYEKIAFWTEQMSSPFAGEVMIYNTNDDYVEETPVYDSGWDVETIFKLLVQFRRHAYVKFKTQKAESNVKQKLQLLSNFDFQGLQRDLDLLDKVKDNYLSENLVGIDFEETIQTFLNKLKTQI